MDHLLLHCKVARILWDDIFNRARVAWVMPRKVVDLLARWKGLLGNCQIAALWKMISLCLMWCL